MTMKEPNFASFLNSFYDSATGILTANTATNYILTPQLIKGTSFLDTLSNTLVAFEQPIGNTLMMMEDDLMGMFQPKANKDHQPLLPFINNGKFHIRGMEAEKMIMIPLIMDFTKRQSEIDRLYYAYPSADRLLPYLKAMIEGIREYYEARPDGLFEFYPFVGIDPNNHSMEYMEKLLSEYVNTSHIMHAPHTIPDKPCYGIKIYPPLGFSPWPDSKSALEKNRYLYSFCEKNRIPIITHCDDQGFRGVSAEEAWANTDPARWRTVLENYPDLIVDFAHFGKQYAITSRSNVQSIAARLRHHPDSPWFYSIISMMKDFDNVYADLSFTGCNPVFYDELRSFMNEQKDDEREKILSRILFGSDFSVNLLKIESYTEYYSIFEESPFSDEEILKIAEENMLRFIGLEEAAIEAKSRRRLMRK